MPLQATSGAASYDAFGGGVPVVPQYIEDVFSTYLYTGTGANQTITNGIDESGKGAMTWIKCRTDATSHALYDTERGAGRFLTPNATSAQSTSGSSRGLSSFNSTGFSLDDDSFSGRTNQSGQNYASWTFREQPKFFDVVTWTGDGTNNRLINHSLGSTPGAIIIKRTNTTSNWVFYHRSLFGYGLFLNTTAAEVSANSDNGFVSNTTDTQFQVTYGAVSADNVNASGSTYVAYLFAHNAGGFGLTGTDNVISCGSFDANLGEVINLGYEPQWLLYKASADVDNWRIADNMRGLTNLSGTNAYTIQQLRPNSSAVESENSGPVLTSTGFTWNQSGGGVKHIYIAIRRGPMKVPTSGTSVFTPISNTSPATGCLTDMVIARQPTGTQNTWNISRLTNAFLQTNTTAAETANASYLNFDTMSGVINAGFLSNSNSIWWNFRRAPSFFDEVCYTGDNVDGKVLNHNLGVPAEFVIQKDRSNTSNWAATVLSKTDSLRLNSTSGALGVKYVTASSSTTFTISSSFNGSPDNYVAYLFATCAGVSKVGTYTGNGTTQTIDCGFTSGARFVLIKRYDSTGDWYVYDTARGMTVLTDPYLLLNSTAAETATLGSVTTVSTGFALDATILAAINTNGASYIFLAIA